jgi:hypothetical protein
MIAATVAPSAGKIPMKVPSPLERTMVHQTRRRSSRDGSFMTRARTRS